MENKTFFKKAMQGILKYSDIFSDVLKKHSPEDMAHMFIAGTPLTTPAEERMLTSWKKPYAFLRVFIYGIIAIVTMVVMNYIWANSIAANGVIIFTSCLIPVTMLLLVWELHIPRDIPLYEVLKALLVGGVLSLLFTMIVETVFDYGDILRLEGDYYAMTAGVTEELAKLAAAYCILVGMKKKRYYALNGLLIGFAIGAGFTMIETTGYCLRLSGEEMIYLTANNSDLVIELLNSGSSDLYSIYEDFMKLGAGTAGIKLAIARAVNSIASHGMWTSISTAGLMMAVGKEQPRAEHFLKIESIIYLVLPMAMHAANNAPIGNSYFFYDLISLKMIVLMIIGLLVWLPLIRKAVNQVAQIAVEANDGLTNAIYAAEEKKPDVVIPVNPNNDSPYNSDNPFLVNKVLVQKPISPVVSQKYYLVGIKGPLQGRKFNLKPGQQFTVGRNADKAVLVMEGCPRVSGVHCEIFFDGNMMLVKDLNSKNGTYINNSRLEPMKAVMVPEESEIQLGDNSCVLSFMKR